MSDLEGALPLEDLLNAISAQLDRAQAALALKTESTGLTFAVKDLNLDLHAAIDIQDAAIMVRPALPGERDVSTLRLSFTTVTRPMLEEHAVEMRAEEPAISDALDGLSDEEIRRLEWVGVRNLNDLSAVESRGGAANLRRLSRLPAARLKQALDLAGQRVVRRVAPVPVDGPMDPAQRLRLRVQGRNLAKRGAMPKASIAGQAVEIVDADRDGLVLELPGKMVAGALTLDWPDGERQDVPIEGDAP